MAGRVRGSIWEESRFLMRSDVISFAEMLAAQIVYRRAEQIVYSGGNGRTEVVENTP
jgi:hypothetical protein